MFLLLVVVTGAAAENLNTFGQGVGPVLLRDVACSGAEYRLLECGNTDLGSTCSHSEDAGVICQAGWLFAHFYIVYIIYYYFLLMCRML